MCKAEGFMDILEKLRERTRDIEISDTNSYLDEALWYKTKMRKLVYKVQEKRFVLDKIDVFKFKYEDEEEAHVQTTDRISGRRRRSRREAVFGKDERLHITEKFVEDYPFATVVRLENGCSGTLISNQHVLTSAHCVHNRTHLTPALEKIRVGFLNTDSSFTWFKAARVFVPPQWSRKKSISSSLNHDYAVIKLTKPHSRRWMPFGVYNLKENNYIQFSGFPSDKTTNQMWFSYCSVSQNSKHVFLNHCDAAPGMSGSGVYVYNKNEEKDRKIVAVFSSYVQYREYGGLKRYDFDANVATRLTAKKVDRICNWLQVGRNCHRLRNKPRRNYF